MAYEINQFFCVLDDDMNIVDYFDTHEEAEECVERLEAKEEH